MRNVLEVDIKEFYPSINHSILLEKLEPYVIEVSYGGKRRIEERILYTWIEKILTIPQIDAFGKPIDYNGRGLPQGLLYSPVLALFYIKDCFKELKPFLMGTEYFAYVDDFRFYCQTEEQANSIKNELTSFLDQLHLEINDEKTNISKIDRTKIIEANIMGKASNLGRAIRNEVILSSDGKTAIKQNLYKLMREAQELCDELLRMHGFKSKLGQRIEKFGLYRIVQLIETSEEWDELASELQEQKILSSNYVAMVHILHKFADTTEKKQKLLQILESVVLNDFYNDLSYIKYVSLQYCFIWSPFEVRLTQSRIDDMIENLINKEILTGTFIKSILSKCHKDWYKLLSEKISTIEFNKDRELKIILWQSIPELCQSEFNIAFPQEFTIQAPSRLEQNEIGLTYRIFSNSPVINKYSNYLPSESFKNIKYLRFTRVRNVSLGNRVWQIKLPKDTVSLKDYSTKINSGSKRYILNSILEWLRIQLNFSERTKMRIPCSVISPEYIWFSQGIDENRGKIVVLGNPFLYNDIYYRKVPNIIWKRQFIDLFECCFGIEIKKRKLQVLSEGIPFWQFRIIQLLEAPYFNLKDFIQSCLNILQDVDIKEEMIVYSQHFRLSHLIRHYIPDHDLHDRFIEITRFTEASWKNGSRECYFFTLHNHEHARFLVFTIHDLIEKTGFQIYLNQREAFRLFVSCFLHDMGMLSEPPETVLYSKENTKDKAHIYDQILAPLSEIAASIKNSNDIKINSSVKKKVFIMNEFVEQLRMEIVRDKHHQISKNEILWDYPKLPLTTAERRDVAEICNAHNIDIYEVNKLAEIVYDGRSPVNLRLLSYLLRLADLCDVSHIRVSKDVLERNEERMGKESIFHWIKHMSVERIEIVRADKDNSSTKINIYHYYLPLMYVNDRTLNEKCGDNCKKHRTIKFEEWEKPVPLIEHHLNEERSTIKYLDGNICNIICAFINKSYNWFYPEVIAINRYFKELKLDIKLDLSILRSEVEEKYDFLYVENRNEQRSAQEFMMDYLLYD